MDKNSFIFCLLVVILGLNQSTNAQTNLLDTQLIKSIFDSDIAKRIDAGEQIIYADKPSGSVEKLKEKIRSNKILKDNFHKDRSIVLTDEEKRIITDELDSSSNYTWPDHLFNNSRRIDNKDLLTAAVAAQSKQRHFVYGFSKPIYIRNNSWALISYARICGGLCGSTETAFYKKVNNTWINYIFISGGDF